MAGSDAAEHDEERRRGPEIKDAEFSRLAPTVGMTFGQKKRLSTRDKAGIIGGSLGVLGLVVGIAAAIFA
jgi:hypothetical protein